MTTPGEADPWARFLTALETGCGTCGGRGRTVRAQWRAWYRQADELVRVAQAARRATDLNPAADLVNGFAGPGFADPAEPSIVTAVDRAIDDHMKARPQCPEEEPCETCHGSGMLLTAAGHRLADLLTRHGFLRDR
ncbi:hypothetical protein E1281_05915 [Actinomadura sp. KC345]|uniref:hypothetical protein n=1 Tax=Actinomadura sp. KC345 TaxID=2530371 RepID=UPI00104477D7|nr:hypothetical protein [Actinomadura sp. KC345]TDC57171.1 hypothetical protein E1281_05915 [Actinomadura sp. KC345]